MQLLKLTNQNQPAKFYGLASDWSILTTAKPMHPAIGWGVPQVNQDTQDWRLMSLGIILHCVKMCRRSQATHRGLKLRLIWLPMRQAFSPW